ncbi:MucR family transcriptional regulator [Blastomonas sp.]|uniref:MucR family transcriptional regulator n=1 Tax=Blastomonas sp. TaxID=1909299 RepID=UPI00406A3B76
MQTEDHQARVTLTADIVVAHVSNNHVAQSELPQLIAAVHGALSRIQTPEPETSETPQEPAVPIRSSIKPDYLVCLEDGKKLTMLKRHLMVQFNLTPEAYRAKWNLPKDYLMVAPSYAARRRELALEIGLGRGGRSETPSAEPASSPEVPEAPQD